MPAAANPQIAIVQVAAVAGNGVIGQGGRLPWRLKSEMRHFRRVTMGRPVVMGRKTYLSIGKPLAGRTNIVVTRDPHFAAPGVLTAASIEAALTAARGDALRRGVAEIAVIGGAEIFNQSMPMTDRLVISQVHLQPHGDTWFPSIDAAVWKEMSRSEHCAGRDDETSFSVVVYHRRTADCMTR